VNDCFCLVSWKGPTTCFFERVLPTWPRICTSAFFWLASLSFSTFRIPAFPANLSGARGVDGLLSKSWRWRRCSCSKTAASVGFLSVSATGFGSQPNPRFNADVARPGLSSNARSGLQIPSSLLFKNSVATYSFSSKFSAGFFKSLRHQLFRSLPVACVFSFSC